MPQGQLGCLDRITLSTVEMQVFRLQVQLLKYCDRARQLLVDALPCPCPCHSCDLVFCPSQLLQEEKRPLGAVTPLAPSLITCHSGPW